MGALLSLRAWYRRNGKWVVVVLVVSVVVLVSLRDRWLRGSPL